MSEEKIIKEEFLKQISTDIEYFFTNAKEKKYTVLEVDKSKKNNYQLILTSNVSFQTTPLEFENIEKAVVKTAGKVALYNELDNVIEDLLTSGYNRLFLGTDDYYDEEPQYISDITAGVPYTDYSPDMAKAVYNLKLDDGKFLRYDLYDTAIRVSQDEVKKKIFYTQDSYTLWYPDYKEAEKAMQSFLDEKNPKAYSFESFKAFVESMDDFERIENDPEEIVFEHLIKSDAYFSKDASELSIPLPQSEFTAFDKDNLEEGRIYFWIKKNENAILKSKISYFILQNRKNNGYIIDSCKLGKFNKSYRHEDTLSTDSMSDEIGYLQKRNKKKGLVEISQEEIIALLTQKNANDVLSQTLENTIYLEDYIYDIYENLVQLWTGVEGSYSKGEFTHHTFFFCDREKQQSWLKTEIANQQNDGYELVDKKENAYLLKHYQSQQNLNKLFLEQKIIKEELLEKYPTLKEKLNDNYQSFMKHSPLKVIEGDHHVKESLLLNADEISLLITGDLIVDGTLMTESEESFYSDNYLIVLGETRVQNYVQNVSFKFMLFTEDFLVKNVTYLPAASRSWYIDIVGKLQTDIFIHTSDSKVKGKDKKIIFNREYSTSNKAIFVDGFFNKKDQTDTTFVFKQLKDGKGLLRKNLNQKEMDEQLFLTAFKNHLSYPQSLYYEFAGFELQELEIGEHYGHYIESDEIVKDIRHATGMYLMSHDDYSLELVKAEKPLNDGELGSEHLAYRFFWIMWTFSDWKHRFDGPMDFWKSIDQINTRYENGIAYYKKDPHLALYWIMHFGLLDDPRYDDMKELMGDSENSLIRGALLFFDELKETKTYSIEIDREQNTTLFRDRIKHHKKQIEKALVPKEDAVAYTLSQFEKQPKHVLEFIREIHIESEKDKQWDKVRKYLDTHPYQIGYSFLHITTSKEDDKSKWHTVFIKEAEAHAKVWEKDYFLVDMFGLIYKELDYDNLYSAILISRERASISSRRKILQKMMDRLKGMAAPEVNYEKRLEGINKDNFDFQMFINKTSDIEIEERIEFIRFCIKKDLFKKKVSKTTVSPYLLVWYLADDDFYPLKQAIKEQYIKEVISHYKLSKEGFNNAYKSIEKSESSQLLKTLKPYL